MTYIMRRKSFVKFFQGNNAFLFWGTGKCRLEKKEFERLKSTTKIYIVKSKKNIYIQWHAMQSLTRKRVNEFTNKNNRTVKPNLSTSQKLEAGECVEKKWGLERVGLGHGGQGTKH